MKEWKSYLPWAVFPLLFLLFFFGVIAVINWDYESKLLIPQTHAADWVGTWLGPILLIGALVLALMAGILLFLVRLKQGDRSFQWTHLLPLTFITIVLIFPSLFIVILTPAAITLIEQTATE